MEVLVLSLMRPECGAHARAGAMTGFSVFSIELNIPANVSAHYKNLWVRCATLKIPKEIAREIAADRRRIMAGWHMFMSVCSRAFKQMHERRYAEVHGATSPTTMLKQTG